MIVVLSTHSVWHFDLRMKVVPIRLRSHLSACTVLAGSALLVTQGVSALETQFTNLVFSTRDFGFESQTSTIGVWSYEIGVAAMAFIPPLGNKVIQSG